jgi:hypothetical protein
MTANLNPPCIHREEQRGVIHCGSCSGNIRFKMFGCAVHGRCTIAKVAGFKCCLGCSERQQPTSNQHRPDSPPHTEQIALVKVCFLALHDFLQRLRVNDLPPLL